MSEKVYQAVLTYGEYSDYTEMTLCVASSRQKAISLGRQYLLNYLDDPKPEYLFSNYNSPEIYIREYPVDKLNPEYSKAVKDTWLADRYDGEPVLEKKSSTPLNRWNRGRKMSEKVKIELSGKELKSIADAFDLYFYDRVNSADQDYKFMSELDEKLLRLAKNGKDEK